MPTLRSFPRVVAATLAVAALTVLPATATAAGPHWLESADVSGPEGFAPGPVSAVTPDGTAVVVYKHGTDPTQVLYASVRDPQSGTWSTPEQISPDGSYVSDFDVASGTDGNVTVVWNNRNGSPFTKARTFAGDHWGAVQTLTTSPSGFTIAPNGDGGVTVAIGTYEAPNNIIRLLARTPGSDTLDADPVDVASSTQGKWDPRLSYNGEGDGVLAWRADAGGGHEELNVARYSRASGQWSAPDTAVNAPEAIRGVCLGIDDDRNVALLWGLGQVDGGGGAQGFGAGMTPGGAWSDPEPLFLAGHGSLATDRTCVAPDQRGHFVAVWQDYALDGGGNAQFATSQALTTTLDVATGAWSAPVSLGDGLGGAPSVTSDSTGNLVAVKLGTTDMIHIQYVAFYRPAGDAGFAEGTALNTEEGAAWCGVPVLGTDVNDNFHVAYGIGPQTYDHCGVGVSLGDASGPALRSLTVPASASVGEAVSVSVSPLDAWSALGQTSWDFGDGGTATGTDATHTYSAPGAYTVTVTGRDAWGNTSEATRTVTVTGPPAPPADDEDTEDETPKPPVVIAPVIEARLAGKTVTVNARVTLKAGQKCKGTITVTTAFGGKTYKVPAKLAVKNGACRATAQITLKKTPSLRTKLRVTVGATKADKKKLTPLTITSRRG